MQWYFSVIRRNDVVIVCNMIILSVTAEKITKILNENMPDGILLQAHQPKYAEHIAPIFSSSASQTFSSIYLIY